MLTSCAVIPLKAKMRLSKPADCSSAKADIEKLEKMKASKFKEKMAMVSLFSPLGLLVGLVTKDINDRAEVANGQYNKRIDNRIVSIKYKCGISTFEVD